MPNQLQFSLGRLLAAVALMCIALGLWQMPSTGRFSDHATCGLLIFSGATGGFGIGLIVRWPKTCIMVGTLLAATYVGFMFFRSYLLIEAPG